MSRPMKVRTCNKSRAEAAVGIMMSHGRYLVPPALECDRRFPHDPHYAECVELASAMLLGRAGQGDCGTKGPSFYVSRDDTNAEATRTTTRIRDQPDPTCTTNANPEPND